MVVNNGGVDLFPRDFPSSSRTGSNVAACDGVGVARALNEFRGRHSEVHLKWPNDLFWGERKLAGLLVESVSGKDALVVGCGINVNQRMEEAPEDRHHSISMYDRCGEMFQLPKVLERVLWHMLRVDDEFRRGETGWQSEFEKPVG